MNTSTPTPAAAWLAVAACSAATKQDDAIVKHTMAMKK